MLNVILICMLLTLRKNKELGADTYNQEGVASTPIKRELAKMAVKDTQALTIRFNAAYCLAKNARFCSEFWDLLTLEEKNGVKNDMYHNKKADANFINTIGTSICQKLLENVENIKYAHADRLKASQL